MIFKDIRTSQNRTQNSIDPGQNDSSVDYQTPTFDLPSYEDAIQLPKIEESAPTEITIQPQDDSPPPPPFSPIPTFSPPPYTEHESNLTVNQSINDSIIVREDSSISITSENRDAL